MGVRAAVNNCVYRWHTSDLWVERERERELVFLALTEKSGMTFKVKLSLPFSSLSVSTLCFFGSFNYFTSVSLIGISGNEALTAQVEQ